MIQPVTGEVRPRETPVLAARVAIGLLVVVGLFLRIWILGRASFNSDQAVVGLMAREILRGHFFAFYWGQHYGGGEPYLVAVLFALFGQSRLVLGIAPILLDGAAALLVWRIGWRLFDARVGVLAALIFWLWPEVYLYLSTVEYGFRLATLVCGLLVVLFALRLTDRQPSRYLNWAVLGLAAGLGWWCSPEIVYLVLPAAVWLAYRAQRGRLRLRLPGVGLVVAAVLLGALPWLAVNVGHRYPSLQTPPAVLHGSTFTQRLATFFSHVAPLVLGLRLRSTGGWLVPSPLGFALYVLLGALLIAWSVVLAYRHRVLLPMLWLAPFPFLYAYSSYAVYWNDGRYALYLAPLLALLVASGVYGLRQWSRLPGWSGRCLPALAVIVALTMSLTAAARLAPYTPLATSGGARSTWTSWRSDPNRQWLGPLVRTLEGPPVCHAYAGYWVAYVLMFESKGGVVASDPGDDRYPPYLAAVERSSRQAWVFARPSTLHQLNTVAGTHQWDPSIGLGDFERALSGRHVPYRSAVAGLFEIVYPQRAVSFGSLLAALGTQANGPSKNL